MILSENKLFNAIVVNELIIVSEAKTCTVVHEFLFY